MIHHSNSSEIDSGRRPEASCSFAVSWIIRRSLEIATRHSLDSCQRPGSGAVGERGGGPELADGHCFRRFCSVGSHAGVLRCLALRGSQTRPVKAILEICAMAQSSCHMSFACLQMPDELSAMIQGIVRERVRRNWPLVRAFEIRSGRRSLQQGEFVAVIRVMPCIGADSRTDTREPLWFGKGAGLLGSGRCGGDAHRIQWLQHTTFKGSSCWMESSSNGPAPTSSIVAAGFHLNPIHLPNRRPYARQFSATCSGALPALSVYYQCPQQLSRCLRALVRTLALDTGLMFVAGF